MFEDFSLHHAYHEAIDFIVEDTGVSIGVLLLAALGVFTLYKFYTARGTRRR